MSVDEEILAVLDSEVDDPWMLGAIGYHLGWANADFAHLPPSRTGRTGKRLRAALVLLSYRGVVADLPSAGTADELGGALALAAALELIHNFSLIHDDIEDRDLMRRGRPTLWTICGEAQAINVGDCLHALAYACMGRLRAQAVNHAHALDLVALLAKASVEVTIGQRHDLTFESERDLDLDLDSYLHMTAGKTAPLIVCSTYGGALLALGDVGPSSRPTLDGFASFGRHLGLGFQIRDDILGIWGAEADTGKAGGGDVRRRKMSFPVVMAFREAPPCSRERLQHLYAKSDDLSNAEESEIRHVLDECHADQVAQSHAEYHCEEAIKALTAAAGGATALRSNSSLARLEHLARVLSMRVT